MGDYTKLNYEEPPLRYEEAFYNNRFDEDYYNDPSKYIPRIEGTELELGVTFMKLNYIPIVTSRVCNGKRKFYLFNFIKVWEKNNYTGSES